MIGSGTLGRMLMRLPEYFDRTPGSIQAIQLVPIAPITVTIAQHRLITQVTDPSMPVLDLDLLTYSLQGLVTFLQMTAPSYGIVLLDDVDPDASAALLMDTEVRIEAAGQLAHFTSTLWALLSPIAWALDAALDAIRSGMQEFSVRTSDGLWLDRWGGEFYGGLIRRADESDTAYATRIIKEVTRWRVNGIALEQIILEDTGFQATITTLHDKAWVIGRTGRDNFPLGYGYIAGRKYSRTTFEVAVDGFSNFIRELIERNRAAGTFPFYAFRQTGGEGVVLESGASANVFRRSHPFIGTDTVWTVGRDPLGRTSIGLSGLIEVAFLFGKEIAEETIFGSGGATSFVLGTSLLGGTDVLGLPSTGGMQIVEDYTECALI